MHTIPSKHERHVSVLPVFVAVLLLSTVHADTPQIVNCDGYPCVNFSFGANISKTGEVFGSLFFNRPQLGEGLDPLGGGQFHFSVDSQSHTASECEIKQVTRQWPFASVRLEHAQWQGVTFSLHVWVPNGLDDGFTGTLPVALADITVTNATPKAHECAVKFTAPGFLKAGLRDLNTDTVTGLVAEKNFVAWVQPVEAMSDKASTTIKLSLSAGETKQIRFMIGHWEDNWPMSARLTEVPKLVNHVARFWTSLLAGTERLEASLPRTGDAQLETYLRWYTTAGVAMTRALKDGTTLTMGYHELNQRDSFWTTWPHLVLWPSLERRMIEESVWGQRPDGKVPTTILPVIEREDDIDINCFFILRALRYVRFHKDDEFGQRILPAVLHAADWLASRDVEKTGLPQGASYWYDWKDVSGVTGRKYSPYASMLYVAANDQLADYCRKLGRTSKAKRLEKRSNSARVLLNRPVSQGGLWNGRYYQQVWHDGRNSTNVLEDQVVGIVFDVVDDDKAASILKALDNNASPWGFRETYPYHPDSFGYRGGDYHNGGIWPWVNHAHAWALFKLGQNTTAIDMLKRMARADLEMAGDYIPHEYLDGQTGKQAGVPMQGWNAAMFGAIYFGLNQNDGFDSKPR